MRDSTVDVAAQLESSNADRVAVHLKLTNVGFREGVSKTVDFDRL